MAGELLSELAKTLNNIQMTQVPTDNKNQRKMISKSFEEALIGSLGQVFKK